LTPLRIAVLNPGGRDPEQNFADFAGEPDEARHPPVNLHAFAACTGGTFYRRAAAIDDERVLLVLRRDLRACLKALRQLQARGKSVVVTLKESGLHQVAELLIKNRKLQLFREICECADGCLSTTPELVYMYHAAGATSVKFIPTPYPLEDERWNFNVPVEQRRGIFIGTRDWNVPSRNHLAALMVARQISNVTAEPVTVFNAGGRRGRRLIEALGFSREKIEIISSWLPYPNYLQTLGRHKIVFQLDRSAVPGQVAGDALLCRMPCVGGDGAIERIAFPGINGFGRSSEELINLATELCIDHEYYAGTVADSQRIAGEQLSFGAGVRNLHELFVSSAR
jgi:hypothetical protein